MRILVTGPRIWRNESLVASALTDGYYFCVNELGLMSTRPTLVYGEAPGLDTMAEREARKRGWKLEGHPAIWYPDGVRLDRTAGHKRNQEMVDSEIDVCLSFLMNCNRSVCIGTTRPHFTHGTVNCMNKADKAHIPIRKYYA